MKCTCQLCPAHFQIRNQNGIYFIFNSPCTCVYKIIYNNCFLSAKYFEEIIRQQHFFKAQLWQTSEGIRNLKNVGLNQANNIQVQESVFCSFTLPLDTEQQLEEVEQFLRNELNFKTLVMYFYTEYFNVLA